MENSLQFILAKDLVVGDVVAHKGYRCVIKNVRYGDVIGLIYFNLCAAANSTQPVIKLSGCCNPTDQFRYFGHEEINQTSDSTSKDEEPQKKITIKAKDLCAGMIVSRDSWGRDIRKRVTNVEKLKGGNSIYVEYTDKEYNHIVGPEFLYYLLSLC